MSKAEEDYLALCRRILEGKSRVRTDRSGTGTLSRFGERLDINLKEGFPLLTTKRVFWNGIVRELLWFISGSMDAKELAKKGVHIWDGHSSRAYLDSRGLIDYPEGVVGPSYGAQWRGVSGSTDQLAEVIANIRKDPTCRRHIVSAWNVADLPKMALPPCHILYQFYVDNAELSCQVYQRSVDVGLGLPFNIASYALLTHLVAHVTGLTVGRLIMCLGDTHIYTNHVTAIEEQLTRTPRPLPQIIIRPGIDNLDSIQETDIALEGYTPHPCLSHPMMMSI